VKGMGAVHKLINNENIFLNIWRDKESGVNS
jgi:hypothetical protein